MEGTLWHGNGTDTGGVGSIVTGNVNVYGDRASPNPVAFDCHIGPASAAIDCGMDAGPKTDIDHQPRPYQTPDVGADEYWPLGAPKYVRLPLVPKSQPRSAREAWDRIGENRTKYLQHLIGRTQGVR